MSQIIRSHIAGAFRGYRSHAIFRLVNGQIWQQRRYKYKYKYAYRPEVFINASGSHGVLDLPIMNDPVDVVRASLAATGVIVSDFEGFNGDSIFQFDDGQVWRQAAYKYSYHYAYRPEAFVIDGMNGLELHVDDMDEPVQVRRVR